MASFYSTVRIHAGLYISGDGRFKIRRTWDELKRRWVWNVYILDEGQFVHDMTFRTLKVARQYVGERTDSFGVHFS